MLGLRVCRISSRRTQFHVSSVFDVLCCRRRRWQNTPPAPPSPPAAKSAQATITPGEPPDAKESPAPEPPKVAPDDPVLTVKGFCGDAKLEGDACKTVLTRAEFEKLANTLQPGMSPAMRRQLATAYAAHVDDVLGRSDRTRPRQDSSLRRACVSPACRFFRRS